MENIIAIQERSTAEADLAFRDFMSLAEKELNNRSRANKSVYQHCSAFELEKISERVLKEVSPATPFRPEQIQLVSGAHFPDILAAQYYGVEVKSTEKDHWTSTGSSIMESTRLSDVRDIYLLFGKLGGDTPEFMCRPYQDCLYDIAVTHSPRYLIDMELKKGESIFDKMGTTYDALRSSDNTIEQVRSYYRNRAIAEHRAEMPWWLESPTNMSLRLWSDGTRAYTTENEHLAAKMFILFPEVFKSDYKRAAMWLCTKYSVLLYNARDTFSAGGQFTHINGHRLPFKLPHIVGEVLNYSKCIKFYLYNPTLIQKEAEELNPALLSNTENFYQHWLNQTHTIIQSLKITTAQKTIAQLGGIPFREWFEADAKLQISNS